MEQKKIVVKIVTEIQSEIQSKNTFNWFITMTQYFMCKFTMCNILMEIIFIHLTTHH